MKTATKTANETILPEGLRRLASKVADANAPNVLDAVSNYHDHPQRVLVAGTAVALEDNNRMLLEQVIREYPLKTA